MTFFSWLLTSVVALSIGVVLGWIFRGRVEDERSRRSFLKPREGRCATCAHPKSDHHVESDDGSEVACVACLCRRFVPVGDATRGVSGSSQ